MTKQPIVITLPSKVQVGTSFEIKGNGEDEFILVQHFPQEHTAHEELKAKYEKLLEFVKSIANYKYYSADTEEFIKEDAEKGYQYAIDILNAIDLLKEIGEE